MLVMRPEQMAAFRADAQQRFAERMRVYIAEEYPAAYAQLGDDGTKRLVRAGIEAGAVYQLETEGAVAVLIELMVQFGERLERSPDRAWAERILQQPGLPGPVKATAVQARLLERTGGRSIVTV